jgi:hypothetical protein
LLLRKSTSTSGQAGILRLPLLDTHRAATTGAHGQLRVGTCRDCPPAVRPSRTLGGRRWRTTISSVVARWADVETWSRPWRFSCSPTMRLNIDKTSDFHASNSL